MRAVADVSAVADPDTGVAVYDTYGLSGWTVSGARVWPPRSSPRFTAWPAGCQVPPPALKGSTKRQRGPLRTRHQRGSSTPSPRAATRAAPAIFATPRTRSSRPVGAGRLAWAPLTGSGLSDPSGRLIRCPSTWSAPLRRVNGQFVDLGVGGRSRRHHPHAISCDAPSEPLGKEVEGFASGERARPVPSTGGLVTRPPLCNGPGHAWWRTSRLVNSNGAGDR